MKQEKGKLNFRQESITYKKLTEELKILAINEEWRAVKVWFTYWESEEEKIYKVLLWGKFFLDNYFRDDSADFHLELIEDFFSNNNEYVAAPRGFSKTTIAQTCICFSVANNLDKFIVVVEKSFTEAAEVLSTVRDIFKNNQAVLEIYGDLIKKFESGILSEKDKDSLGDLFINGVRLRGKGFNTPIRGLKSKEWRPTKIICDDVESDEHIRNQEQRLKYQDNFLKGILPAVDIDCPVKVFGTILHNDSLLNNLIKQHNGKIYKAYDKNDPENTLLWEERWSYERLEKKREQMIMDGVGSTKFYAEYLNEPIDDEFRHFKWEWLQNNYVQDDLKLRVLNRYIAIDTADSKKAGADFTGVIVVDWDSDNNWFIRYAKRYKVNLPELIKLIFNLWETFKPVAIGIEKKSFVDQIKPFLDIKSQEIDIYPIVRQLDDMGKRKEDRIIGSLEGRFEAGKIWFLKNSFDDQKLLKSELYDFPGSKNDDLSDSLSYITELGARPYSKKKEQPTTINQEFFAHRKLKKSADPLEGII